MADVPAAINLFVAAWLIILVTAILLPSRRSPAALVLASFLCLVAANFLFNAVYNLTGDRGWQHAAFVALALDPPFLLLFVSLYPYRRRSPVVVGALTISALWAAASMVLALTQPENAVLRGHWANAVIIAELAFSYAAAWFLSILATVKAPTGQLRHRAAWMAGATGVAVVPRLGFIPEDLRLDMTFISSASANALADAAARVLITSAIMLLFLGIGFWVAQERRKVLRPSFRLVLWFVLAIAGIRLATGALDLFVLASFRLTIPYGLRWIVFAFILMHGLLAYELVGFQRASDQMIRRVGAAFGAVAAFLTLFLIADAQGAGAAWATTAGIGAAAIVAVPTGHALTRAARKLEQSYDSAKMDRRLELYQAALETVWAGGTPTASQRNRLEAERRAFGVNADEARALEHVVMQRFQPRNRRLAPGDEPLTGVVIGEVLGEGSHGRVFAAVDHETQRPVVVKEFHPPSGLSDPARQRWLAEARSLQALSHPNIARLLKHEVVNGSHLLVLEKVPGKPLPDRLNKGPLPTRRVRSVLDHLLSALEAAHAQGVIHRDIKPANVLVDHDDRAWLIDFGIADSSAGLDETVDVGTRLGSASGTLRYMAPEQASGAAVDARADLYALALIAFEALTGKPALDLRGHTHSSGLEIVRRPKHNLRSVPEAWRPFLKRALAVDPQERFPSAREMRSALPRG